MCMISGYLGSNSASQVLLEMTRRQEAIFGGYYSGIATIDGQAIHRKRCVGSVASLEKENLSALLGCIGIAHSRTDDGGGIEYSQPRIDQTNTLSAVGVGIGGIFSVRGQTSKLAEELLLEEGVEFRTRNHNQKKNGINLSDGMFVHAGEVYLMGISREYQRTKDLLTAIRCIGHKSEAVSMFITSDRPDCIFISNNNQRVLVAKQEGETFLATSKIAFPRRTFEIRELPINSFTTVTRGQIKSEVLWEKEERFDYTEPTEAKDIFFEFVKMNPGLTWHEVVSAALEPILPEKKATMSQILGHRIFEELIADGSIRTDLIFTLGRDGQGDIPQLRIYEK